MLKQLYDTIIIGETKDLSQLSPEVIKDLRTNIIDGAKDLNQQWINALHLVHKAYQVSGVERPDPSLQAAWKQYEQNIEYAVDQLAKYRGLDADWRISAQLVEKAISELNDLLFDVKILNTKHNKLKQFKVYGADLQDVIDCIISQVQHQYQPIIVKQDNQNAILTFFEFNIKKKIKIIIKQTA